MSLLHPIPEEGLNMNPFTLVFQEVEKTIAFEREWENGTGYFDGAVSAVELAPGQRAKSVAGDGRRLIFVGTRLGTVVAFERYSPIGEERCNVIVTNTPKGIGDVLPSGQVGENDQWAFLGKHRNIGTILERLAKVLKV